MILEFSVGNDIFKRNNLTTILDQSTDYYKCKFYLKKEVWNNSIISVTFTSNNGYIETITLGEYDEMLSCLIPADIVSTGHCQLYLFSNDNRKTNTIHVALTNHYRKAEEKCNVISEIFGHLNEKIDNIVYENFQLKCYSDGTLKDVVYLGNIDHELIAELVDAELKKHSFADVAFSGSYNDLTDVPETFTPSAHTHSTSHITDFDNSISKELDIFLDNVIESL